MTVEWKNFLSTGLKPLTEIFQAKHEFPRQATRKWSRRSHFNPPVSKSDIRLIREDFPPVIDGRTNGRQLTSEQFVKKNNDLSTCVTKVSRISKILPVPFAENFIIQLRCSICLANLENKKALGLTSVCVRFIHEEMNTGESRLRIPRILSLIRDNHGI